MTASELDSQSCPAIMLHDLPSHVTKTGLADGICRTLRFPLLHSSWPFPVTGLPMIQIRCDILHCVP